MKNVSTIEAFVVIIRQPQSTGGGRAYVILKKFAKTTLRYEKGCLYLIWGILSTTPFKNSKISRVTCICLEAR